MQYNIDERLLDWCITKLTVIKYLSIEYKVVDNSEEEKDYAKFDESLARLDLILILFLIHIVFILDYLGNVAII